MMMVGRWIVEESSVEVAHGDVEKDKTDFAVLTHKDDDVSIIKLVGCVEPILFLSKPHILFALAPVLELSLRQAILSPDRNL